MPTPLPTDNLPPGDVQFYDYYQPALDAGDYSITVKHTVDVAPSAFTKSQNFTVKGPQFTLPAGDVCSVFPPANTSGNFAENLAHVVLAKKILPWERELNNDMAVATPWMCLFTFNENELSGGNEDTKASTVTIGSLKQPADGIVKPQVTVEADIDPDNTCQVVLVPGKTLKQILPAANELKYLAHVRQVNTDGQEDLGLKDSGWFSAVLSNRFPDSGNAATGVGARNIVHLVSIEGFEEYVSNPSSIDETKQYQFVTLTAWSFTCLPDQGETFRDLMENFVTAEASEPGNLLLKLPLQVTDTSAEGAAVAAKIKKGYVPLGYKARSGENSFAWYRGPLLPEKTTIFQKTNPFSSSSSATVYDSIYGLFDQSLAAAWQLGRSIALSDRVFSQTLFQYRKNASQSVDLLMERSPSLTLVTSPGKPMINSLAVPKPVRQNVINFLNGNPRNYFSGLTKKKVVTAPRENPVKGVKNGFFSILLLACIKWIRHMWAILLEGGKRRAVSPSPLPAVVTATSPVTVMKGSVAPPHRALMEFMKTPGLAAVVSENHTDDLSSIGSWLAGLHALKKVPFVHLVPDPAMLPVESIRFFYVDPNWLEALADGALSIGAHSSKDTLFINLMKGEIRSSINTALQSARAGIPGADISSASAADAFDLPLTGLLIRSAVVSGWPGLVVKAFQNNAMLKNERMERLAPNVLLCLFLGVPDQVVISEPQHSLRFGIDDTGSTELRRLAAPVGHPLGKTALVRKLNPGAQGVEYMRKDDAGTSTRVLDIFPDAGNPSGLVKALADQLEADVTTVGPAGFAIQMVQAPEELTFNALKTT